MRKITKAVLAVLMSISILSMPAMVNAKTYVVDGTDITIEIGDEWHVMTRDNPTCCEEVEAAGVKAEDMQEFFIIQKMYLDAVAVAEDENDRLEMFIRKSDSVGTIDLSELTDEEMNEMVTEFESQYAPKVCKEYKNNYRYIYIEQEDEQANCIDFITIVNSEIYTVTFQKVNEFTSEDMKTIYEIVDSARYTISREDESSFNWDNVNWKYVIINGIIGGAAAGGIVAVIALLIKKKKASK